MYQAYWYRPSAESALNLILRLPTRSFLITSWRTQKTASTNTRTARQSWRAIKTKTTMNALNQPFVFSSAQSLPWGSVLNIVIESLARKWEVVVSEHFRHYLGGRSIQKLNCTENTGFRRVVGMTLG